MNSILPENLQRSVRSPWSLIRGSGIVLYAAALFSMAAALIHLWVAPEHFGEWWGYGAFMLAAAVCQGLYAAVLLRWPSSGLILYVGIAGNLAIIVLYALTRTIEIPLGPHAGHSEAFGASDLLCTASELGLVMALAVLLRALRPDGASSDILAGGVAYSRASARPLAFTLFTFILAYGGGLWLYLLHRAEGSVELNEPPFLIHWLRDSTLALPLVLLAVWLGVGIARRILDGRGSSSRALSGAITAATVAALASAFMASGSPIHAILFNAHDGGHDLPVYLHVGRDALLVLAVNLPLAALVCLMLRGDPWARPEASSRVRHLQFRGRFIAQGASAALGLMLPAVILAWGALGDAQSAAAANEPGSPCPVSAPVKTFDVTAIDVDITLNRFGDHDPAGKMYVLTGIDGQATNGVQKVRQEETAPLPGRVSIGLHGHDEIQPLVIRANQGDCVKIDFHNQATGGAYGIHIDGLAFKVGSSGDQIGNNTSSAVPNGGSLSYEYYLPNDDTLEGSHYIRPGPGNREAVSHGLFGSLMVEPPGSEYLALDSGGPVDSGWEASIVPGGATADPSDDAPSFREFAMLHHEIGNEKFKIKNVNGGDLPTVDPHTDSYRPGSRALNYRSEPFMNRLDLDHEQKSLSYNSYTFGDPATPMPRGYLSDPTKIRLVHAGTEMFHVYHLHGGGDRWRFNPVADTTYNYADTGLKKHPETTHSPSSRLDSQAIGPGESYNLEIEGGAGGVQQSVGDFLFHCHIAKHYNSGMWSFWRTYNTLQDDFKPLPDRVPLPKAIDSAGLIGKTFDGGTITKDNLKSWVERQVPTQGVPKNTQDASVWNWKWDDSNPAGPVALGEPEDKTPWPGHPGQLWPDLADGSHPGGLPGDQFVGDRPKIMFDPVSGRPAFPLLRPHIAQRSPFAGNGHSGAPYLGASGDQVPDPNAPGGVDPYARRADGLCPSRTAGGAPTPLRNFNITSFVTPIQVTADGRTDQTGMIFALNKDRAAIQAGNKPAQPLAIRGNIGDCVQINFNTELTDAASFGNFAKGNMHIHHVQFDIQGSDGASAGFVYDQSVRPYKVVDPQLTQAANQGDTVLHLSSVAKFQDGVWIEVGEGTDNLDVRQIESVNAAANTVTLTRPLEKSHAVNEWAGTEFMRYRWYPDVELDNIFWHDHVDGIHGWGKGLVAQLIVEPEGSTYHDPKTGAQVDSGTIVDIHANNPLAPGVPGSFREMALWTIDENPATDSTINLRAEPWADRLANNGDPSLLFSSYTHGDPNTPLPKAYPGDPFVIRTINVSGGVDTLHIDGHRIFVENRYADENGKTEASPLDTIHYGISEKYTAILEGGAGGPDHRPGDYLYQNGMGRRFTQGAWGILRVLAGQSPDLQPLPGHPAPAGGGLPSPNNGRPPAASDPGNPCQAGATPHDFNVSAVDVPNPTPGHEVAFVPTGAGAAAANEPLVLHAAAGECVNVTFKNESSNNRASFHVGKLERTPESSGINVGFNPEQTVAIGGTRQYRFYADTEKIGSAVISDFGGSPVVPDPLTGAVPTDVDTGPHGLYGAIVVAPQGATFSDPTSGAATDVGAQVDVHLPGAEPSGYRDFTLAFAEDDPRIGQDGMPYPIDAAGPALVNYESAPLLNDSNAAFGGNQPTPLLRAYRGDSVRVHAIGAPGSEQMHVFNLGGLSWPIDAYIDNSSNMTNLGFGPLESIDAEINGGAGGRSHSIGDFFYGDMRRPFTQAGMWGIFRVSSDAGCAPDGTALKALPGRDCVGNIDQDAPTLTADPRAGLFNTSQQVKILTSEPAKIHFTTDGSKPTQRSPLYKGPITVDKTKTIKAIALDGAGNKSGVASWDFTIDTVVPTMSASPKPGTYDKAQQVKLKASESGSRIFYTTNGSTPTPQSPELLPGKTIPVSVSSSIKAIAVDPAGNKGAVATFAYKIRQASKVTLNVSTAPLKLGNKRTIAGAVSPSHTGSVKLTIKRNGKTVLTKSLPLKSSRFSYPYKPRAVGSYSVSVSFAGDADHIPSTASKSFNVIR